MNSSSSPWTLAIPNQVLGHRHDIPAVEARLLGPLEVVRDKATSLAISAARCAAHNRSLVCGSRPGQHGGELVVEVDRAG